MEENIYQLSDKLNYILNVRESDKDRFKKMITWVGEMMDLTIKERLVKDMFPKRGEIWTAQLGENVGCELNKVRPVLVFSNDIGNKNAPTVGGIPISHKEERQPTHVTLNHEHFTSMVSHVEGTVLTEQYRVLSKARLGRKIAELNEPAIKLVEQAILISLGIPTA